MFFNISDIFIISFSAAIDGITNDCVFQCPSEIKTVCGSDNVGYFNECFLCRTACIKPGLSKACDGDCPCAAGETDPKDVETTKTTTIKRNGQPDEVVEVKYRGGKPVEYMKDNEKVTIQKERSLGGKGRSNSGRILKKEDKTPENLQDADDVSETTKNNKKKDNKKKDNKEKNHKKSDQFKDKNKKKNAADDSDTEEKKKKLKKKKNLHMEF